jgi:CDP-diacylglycerol--glycerol-3-phosphate 3-phosphatidyltransferase
VTVATKITVFRLAMIPVFAWLAWSYGRGAAAGSSDESLREWALFVFLAAAVSDGVDGWVARRFHQRSDLGAFLDPIADKGLLMTAVLVLSVGAWGLPWWFVGVVLAKDALTLLGIGYLRWRGSLVPIDPLWWGKASTVLQIFAIALVMWRPSGIDVAWPCAVAAGVTLVAAVLYGREGVRQWAGSRRATA